MVMTTAINCALQRQKEDYIYTMDNIGPCLLTGADSEGGAGGARPPVFAPNSFKSPLNWPKHA